MQWAGILEESDPHRGWPLLVPTCFMGTFPWLVNGASAGGFEVQVGLLG